ncbi:Fanconi anemia group J protein homolog [Cryptotermes secundus]|uniref:Fanconi anemia group J protein homolog n=1 Tax=Cryptotermes secundus TaxID=105785 RepID=UPI001454C685|nr:Fanconi anemia group J protein homolog [Cryptotermes secundus]
MQGNKDFLPTIQAYYRSVHQCELGIGKGPLLFAIMRGKVSEGLDFADNRARGVITVGIPYPHLYDVQVGLKKKYNDANIKRGLKSGAQWYETQAYRALNQALGRCIRHKNDWGALIIIDKRFMTEEKHVQGLSKWIRRKVQPFATFEKLHSSLRNFVHSHSPVVPEHVVE